MTEANFKFRKLLVATDFSECSAAALGRAVRLAEHSGAVVTVLHVIPEIASAVPGSSFEAHWVMPSEELKRSERKLRREAAGRLAGWLEPHRKLLPRLCTEIRVGPPFAEIIGAVQKGGYDLVLAGTRGLSGVKRFLLGSTAERLVRKCPCPVWVVKPEHEWPLTSILAPVDCSPVSGKSLEVAARLARLCLCPLTVLHVFQTSGDSSGAFRSWRTLEETAADHPDVRRTAAEALRRMVEEHIPAGVSVHQRLAVGAPWQAISRVARQMDAGLIVMGSIGRSGVPGLLIGNTAEKVLRSCDRSILAVKPDGFVSPVRPTDSTALVGVAGNGFA